MNFPRKLVIASAMLASAATAGFAATSPTTLEVDLLDSAKLPLEVKIDKTAAKSGVFIFNIANQSKLRSQGLIVARLKSTDATELANIKNNKIDMTMFKRVAEIDGIRSHEKFTVRAVLKAGDYVLLYRDNKVLKSAMDTPLTVSN
jgi:hypothetical protein